MKKISKEVLGFIVFIILGYAGWKVIGQIDDYFKNQPKSRSYVYACPVDKSTKCYEIPADEPICTETSPDGCQSWDTNLYFPNGNSISLNCFPGKGSKLTCLEYESSVDKRWEIQETGQKTKEKYYSNGKLAR